MQKYASGEKTCQFETSVVLATLILCMKCLHNQADDTEVKLVGMQYTSTKKCRWSIF